MRNSISRVGWIVVALGACDSGGARLAVDGGNVGSGAVRSPATPSQPPLAGAALDHGVVALSLDDQGVPRLLRAARTLPAPAAAGTDAVAAARAHVAALAPVWGIAGQPPAQLEPAAVLPLAGGATIVTLRQRINGLPVWGGRLGVLEDSRRALLAVSGTARSALAAPRATDFHLTAAEALAIAASDRGLSASAIVAAASPGRDWQRLRAQGLGPAQAERALVGAPLRPTWVVELYGPRARGRTVAWRVFVDATSGAAFDRDDLVADDAFRYRVFADADAAGRPFDGPQDSWDPDPTGQPGAGQPAFVAPNLVTMEGFNTNPNGTDDPWLAPGATVTSGNNVDAYVDLNDNQDGFTPGTDFRAATTSAGVFDYSYDTASAPDVDKGQQMAAITSLFYINNWLHDWWYDSGFTEATGNAQVDNYGRGGVGGDPIHAEAQDDLLGGSTDNANMATPSDGMSPRMQMYVWSGLSEHTLTVDPGGLDLQNGIATSFGAQVFDVAADVVLASPADACSSIADATGKIVLVDRGTCTFVQKDQAVQAAHGVGMIVANNTTGTVAMGGTGAGTLPPAMSISIDDGTTMKTLLGQGTVTAHMVRTAAGPVRDGDIDTSVVSHEWGHYLHHRLASCGSPTQCNAMSEGWGDFDALMTLVRSGDDPTGTYAMGIYAGASFGDPYFGIRRAPYSVDFSKNGFTFIDIGASATLPGGFPIAFSGNNNEVHNAGEIWAGMLWEVYSSLIQADGYATAHRAMSDYVVASLLMTPANATYTEARDALLTTIAAASTGDAVLAAQAFARRGAGSCAQSPPRSSTTLDGVVESYAVAGVLGVGDLTLTDDVQSCDNDGILDAGEVGTLRVAIVNGGPGTLSSTQIAVTTTTAGVTISNGTHAAAPVAPYSTGIESFQVALAPSITAQTDIAFHVQLADSAACITSVGKDASIHANYDDLPASSTSDDVESAHPVWTPTGTAGVWSREVIGAGHAWHGTDVASVGDAQLVSPPLDVAAAPARFTVSFSHLYDFDYTTGPPTAHDGGVLELSTDNGATWTDAASLGVTPGYNVTLSNSGGNPLAGQRAYGHRSPSYPNRNTVSLDFGTQLAGQTVLLRFRIGTDGANGAYGWEIDDLAFGGITNTPFSTIVDQQSCTPPPDAMVDAPPPPPVDAMPDASVPDAMVDAPPPPIDAMPDAPVPDAMPIDATPDASAPDAMPIDAPPPPSDATPGDATTAAPDAGVPVGQAGGCCSTSGGDPSSSLLLAIGLGAVLNRRRRRTS